MKRVTLAAALMAGSALVSTALAQSERSNETSQAGAQSQPQPQGRLSASQFVQHAARSGRFEIEAGKVGMNRTQNEQVRSFAERLVNDHQRAGDQLRSVADIEGAATELSDEATATLQRLRNVRGPAFDRLFVQTQIEAHDDAISLYENYIRTADNTRLRDHAERILPTLREHLRIAEQINRALPPARVGANQGPRTGQANQGASMGQSAGDRRSDGSRIVVQQPAPSVQVDQSAPQVSVRQPQPDVTVRQGVPQITIRQRQPTVTVDIPQPEVIVRMPRPDVNVSMAQPEVQVRQPQPNVQVQQRRDDPQVQVERERPVVNVTRDDGQPRVEVTRSDQQPQIRYEQAEPRVVVNQQEGQPAVRVLGPDEQAGPRTRAVAGREDTEGTARDRTATGRTAAQARDDDGSDALRDRLNAGEPETTASLSAGGSGPSRSIVVSRLEDMDVFNARNEKLGEVNRIVLDSQNRRYLVIGAGGFLGLGRDYVAFPLERFWLRGDRLVIRGVTDDDIDAMDDYRDQLDGMRRLTANDRAQIRIWQ